MLAGVVAFPTPVQPKQTKARKATMNKTITLPSGNTVELKDPATLLKKDRDKILEMAGEADNQTMQAVAIQDGIIAVSVLNWSFDLIPPSIRIASLGELTPRDFQALVNATATAQEFLFPTLDAGDDPKAPTANSND